MSSPVATPPDTYPPLPPPMPAVAVARPPKRPGLALVLAPCSPASASSTTARPRRPSRCSRPLRPPSTSPDEVGMPFALVIPFVVFYSAIDAYRSAVAINLRCAGRSPGAGVRGRRGVAGVGRRCCSGSASCSS